MGAKIIQTTQSDFKVLQHLKGAMEWSRKNNAMEAYFLEKDLFQHQLTKLVT